MCDRTPDYFLQEQQDFDFDILRRAADDMGFHLKKARFGGYKLVGYGMHPEVFRYDTLAEVAKNPFISWMLKPNNKGS